MTKYLKRKREASKSYKEELKALTASMYKYPCQNMSLVDMDGEVWKPFPELPNRYAISNKGRVKSLAHETLCKNGIIHTHKDRILKQRVHKRINPYTKEYGYILCINTVVDNKTRGYTISRLVYEAFIEPIDNKYPNHVVRHKDGDNFNNLLENLYLSSKSDLIRDTFETGKRTPLTNLQNPALWTAEEWESLHKIHRKAISQFDLDGNYVKTYESVREATKSIGIKNPTSISGALKGKAHTIGGYQWRLGTSRSPMKPVKPIKEHLKKPFRARKCAKYDLQGHLLSTYDSVKEAAQENNQRASFLLGLLNHPDKIPKGGKQFIWKSFQEDENVPKKIKP